MIKQETKQLADQLFKTQTVTIGEAIPLFIAHHKARGNRPKTIETYQNRLNVFCRHFSLHMPLPDIDETMLDAWVVSLSEPQTIIYPNYTKELPDGLSAHSKRGYVRDIKTFLQFCYRRGWLPRDIAQTLKPRMPDMEANSRAMSLDDLSRMIAISQADVKKGNPRNLALLLFFADTASRRGEVAGLKINDLELPDLSAMVDGKTGPGKVYFTEDTRQALENWLTARPVVDHDFVFTTIGRGGTQQGNYGKPLPPEAISRLFRRMGKRAGVQGRCNPHSLRHLAGNQYARKTDIALTARKLRHRDVYTTAQFYVQYDDAEVKAATVLHSPLKGLV
jgi:integrase